MKICRARPQLVFTFDNRFSSNGCEAQLSVRYIIFHLQASYLSATSHTGRKSCRVKSLYMKRFWVWLTCSCTWWLRCIPSCRPPGPPRWPGRSPWRAGRSPAGQCTRSWPALKPAEIMKGQDKKVTASAEIFWLLPIFLTIFLTYNLWHLRIVRATVQLLS